MKTEKIKPILEKPLPPKQLDTKDYPKNDATQWFIDWKKYEERGKKYEEDLEIYEQTKLIRFIKNADIKLILKKYRITKL